LNDDGSVDVGVATFFISYVLLGGDCESLL